MEPHLCNHRRQMAPRHPRAYLPTSQKDLAVFYHQTICCPTKRTLLQEIKDGSFSTWSGLTEKPITKYLPESEITEKGHLYQQKQRPEAAVSSPVMYSQWSPQPLADRGRLGVHALRRGGSAGMPRANSS